MLYQIKTLELVRSPFFFLGIPINSVAYNANWNCQKCFLFIIKRGIILFNLKVHVNKNRVMEVKPNEK
jgi:hypothetical protein